MTTELQIVERAETALGFAERKAELAELAKKSVRIVEITNAAGYQECRAARMVLKNTRVDIQKVGKEARDDATKFSKAVIAKEKELIELIEPEENRLSSIQETWDQARVAEKRAKDEVERQRVAAIQERIAAIQNEPVNVAGKPAVIIRGRLERMRGELPAEADFAEFHAHAVAAHASTISKLETLIDQQIAHEAEQAKIKAEREELERLRKEQAERLAEEDRKAAAARADQQRIDRERREKEEAEHRARLAEEAEQRAAQEAEERAKREADEKERRESEERELAARREATAAEERRLAAERARLVKEKAEAERAAREKALAEVTLESAAQAAYELLLAEGYGDHIVVAQLARALGADAQQVAA